MSFEDILNIGLGTFLLCVFIVTVYVLISGAKDQGTGKWDMFVGMGIVVVVTECFDIFYFLVLRQDCGSWRDYFLLRATCASTIELSYTFVAALLVAALWIGVLMFYRSLKKK
ncbi:MAG TPA: hypothetical protein VJ396_00290 [Acidiferrobacterales bacterium]|nr:hypothetical protein [Acidiferrobacterales bacterium]